MIKGSSAVGGWTDNLEERRVSMKEQFSMGCFGDSLEPSMPGFILLVPEHAARMPRSPGHWDLTTGWHSLEKMLK